MIQVWVGHWRRFWKMPHYHRGLLSLAFLLLPFTKISLHWLGLRRSQQIMQKLLPLGSYWLYVFRPDPPLMDQPRRVAITAHLVHVAAHRGLVMGNCLQQAMTLWWLLACQQITSSLKIGVCKEANQLQAHAWIEWEGLVIGALDQRFQPFTKTVVGS